jgi:hypothetical protein
LAACSRPEKNEFSDGIGDLRAADLVNRKLRLAHLEVVAHELDGVALAHPRPTLDERTADVEEQTLVDERSQRGDRGCRHAIRAPPEGVFVQGSGALEVLGHGNIPFFRSSGP